MHDSWDTLHIYLIYICEGMLRAGVQSRTEQAAEGIKQIQGLWGLWDVLHPYMHSHSEESLVSFRLLWFLRARIALSKGVFLS